ncbi:MAG: IS91 family transposase, partial [Pseudomonadota bacterium]|nr:IS91 family transposase [Pseudomonadota bacterium]
EMRIIAFITDPTTVRDILAHLGEPSSAPTVAPARGPPLWDMPDAGPREIDQAQPAPEYEFDQRIAW